MRDKYCTSHQNYIVTDYHVWLPLASIDFVRIESIWITGLSLIFLSNDFSFYNVLYKLKGMHDFS